MNWEIEYLHEEGVLAVKTSGTLANVDENQKLIAEVLAALKKYDVTKCLIDDRDLTLKLKTMDIYNLPELISKLGVSRTYRVALVVAESAQDNEGFEFYETRAYNLGYKHRLFTDIEAALGWLSQ
jgi:hypothetical protein